MKEYMDIYLVEAREHLETMDEALMKLEKDPKNGELLNMIFRAAHTIKGSSGSMGFLRVQELTHAMEDLLQDLRSSKFQANKEIIELLFECHDFLAGCMDSLARRESDDDIEIEVLRNKLRLFLEQKSLPPVMPVESKSFDSQHVSETPEQSQENEAHQELILGKNELMVLKDALNTGSMALVVRVRIENTCMLRGVRVFMVFDELEKHGSVLASIPDKPSLDAFKNGSFIFNGTDLYAVVLTDEDGKEIASGVNTISEIETVYAEPLNIAKEDLDKNQLTLHMSRRSVAVDVAGDHVQSLPAEKKTIGESPMGNKGFNYQYLAAVKEQIDKIEISAMVLETDPFDQQAAYTLYKYFHTIRGLSDFYENALIQRISGYMEIVLEDYRKGRISLGNYIVDILLKSSGFIKLVLDTPGIEEDSLFLSVVDEHLDMLEKKHFSAEPENTVNLHAKEERCEKKLGEIFVEQGMLSGEEVETLLEHQKDHFKDLMIGQVAIKEGRLKAEDVVGSLRMQDEQKGKQKGGPGAADVTFIRIPTQKVDTLVDMLGELLILHSLFEQDTVGRVGEDDRYMSNLMRTSKIIKDIQNLSMSLRMISLKQTFQKLMRIGRDTASELQKNVEINLYGEDTEIDRSVTDKLMDPLMHLVRNAVSHGIESEQERIEGGKSPAGHVSLSAYSKRGSIYIEIIDDGKGLDHERILKKARDMNLVDPQANYSPEEIVRFIFLPGFSTQESINNISGRGVGMNVVETEINKMGGRVEIHSNKGQGSTFRLKIPLNLAVVNGTIVNIYGNRYIIPTIYIKEFFKPTEEQWVSVRGDKSMLKVRNDIMSVIPIWDVFGLLRDESQDEEKMIVVIELEQKFRALPVRAVIGRQEVVAKPLGSEFAGLSFLSGASILGDGKVSMILDVESIFRAGDKTNTERM